MVIRSSGLLTEKLNELGHTLYFPFPTLSPDWVEEMGAISQADTSCGWIPLKLFFNRIVPYNVLNNFFPKYARNSFHLW